MASLKQHETAATTEPDTKETPRSAYRYASLAELEAGGLCLDSVGHVLEVGRHMTCMCCGATGVVDELKTGPEEGWNFDGSQWVRTPKWVIRLREENLRLAQEKDPRPVKQPDTRDTKEPNMGTPSPPPSELRSTCCAGVGCINCDGTGLLLDQPIASVEHGTDGHDGPGWYYWDSEYLDEGSVGAFATREEAEKHANEAGYRFQTEKECPVCGPGPCVPSAHGMGPDWT